jgi:hypothetical protein
MTKDEKFVHLESYAERDLDAAELIMINYIGV